jgi:hypothetical protein
MLIEGWDLSNRPARMSLSTIFAISPLIFVGGPTLRSSRHNMDNQTRRGILSRSGCAQSGCPWQSRFKRSRLDIEVFLGTVHVVLVCHSLAITT